MYRNKSIMEVKATDLRIGNLIFDNISEEPTIVDWVTIKVCYLEDDVYEPIPLTEEWLLKFGFEKDENIGFDDFIFSIDIFNIFQCKYELNSFSYPLLMRYGNPNEYKSATSVFYVHQLQNLYKALTGEELKIK